MSKPISELVQELKKASGLGHVYISPPQEGMKYPCVKLNLDGENVRRADNKRYFKINKYLVMVIDKNPDSTIYERILNYFPCCSLSRSPYCVDGLTHFVLTLYY